MQKALLVVLALFACSQTLSMNHEQTSGFHCCPTGYVFDSRLLQCVCPAGTSPTGPLKICCPPDTTPTPDGKCACTAPKYLNELSKQC